MLAENERITLEDLELLAETCDRSPLRERDVRATSAILRRQLIDGGGVLAQVAKQREVKLQVSAPVIERTVDAVAGSAIFFVGGNAEVGGVSLANLVMMRGNVRVPEFEEERPEKRQLLSLGKFKNQVSVTWNGYPINREQLIKFVANKLGGVHFDEKRTREVEIALEDIRGRTTMLGLDGVYFELLATARFISESETVQALVSTLSAPR